MGWSTVVVFVNSDQERERNPHDVQIKSPDRWWIWRSTLSPVFRSRLSTNQWRRLSSVFLSVVSDEFDNLLPEAMIEKDSGLSSRARMMKEQNGSVKTGPDLLLSAVLGTRWEEKEKGKKKGRGRERRKKRLGSVVVCVCIRVFE